MAAGRDAPVRCARLPRPAEGGGGRPRCAPCSISCPLQEVCAMSRIWRGSTKTPTPRNPPPAPRPPGRAPRPSVEPLEERCLLASGFRSITGFGNNVNNPDWGSANVALLRTAPVAYDDGIDDPVVGSPARPSPRVVSNTVVAQTTEE